jgi:hypothetical protein
MSANVPDPDNSVSNARVVVFSDNTYS